MSETSGETDFEGASARQRQIYVEAARLFVSKGFANTSMGDIADAVGMSKAGLYHSIASKEDLLYIMINFGLDQFERDVVKPAEAVADPLLRLKTAIRGHVLNIGRVSDPGGNPFTIVVNDTVGLSPKRQKFVSARKRRYMTFLRDTLDELKARRLLEKDIDTTVAAFSIIGMVLAVAKWRRPKGRVSLDDIADQIVAMAMRGVLK